MSRKRDHLIDFILLIGMLAGILALTGCGETGPTGPSFIVTPSPQVITYAINLPSFQEVEGLRSRYPEGISLPPVVAQSTWDRTASYGGSPNVYFGPLAPTCPFQYQRVGIVVAPVGAASSLFFTAKDWPGPLEAGVTYTWLGRFEYVPLPPVNSYILGGCIPY